MSLRPRLVDLWFRYFGRDDLVRIDVPGGYRVGKVRAWGCRGRTYMRGDAVPHMKGHSTYSVETVQGWWVCVAKGKVASWSVKPICSPIVRRDGKVLLSGRR